MAYHWFWLNEPANDSWYAAANQNAPLFSYTGSAPGAKSEAGQEIDITVETSHLKSITTLFGYGHFFTGAYVDQRLGSKAEDASYVFGQAKLEF